ncbi:TetR family transcriptional regulator, partial [Enterococcus faecium]|nr:TetR family transcriptional regulator [Enterococcus faecium]
PIEITMFVISIGAIFLRLFFYFSSISHANAR